MGIIKRIFPGFVLTFLIALLSRYLATYIPGGIISAGVFALLLGMLFNPIFRNYEGLIPGVNFVSKKILRLAIILMGATLSFGQVMEVGKFSLIVMVFTLATAFGGGYLLGRLFGMDWKLSGLISAGTGICGGSAIAAIAPTIDARAQDVAYSISATFVFDILMVILFPLAGRYFGMSDLGFGLWTGTAVNDTSSVVAAGYAFSEAAGNFSLIVKLTRTLSIVPIVLIFSYINAKISGETGEKVDIGRIFPYFIIMFIVMVALKSGGLITNELSGRISFVSRFAMTMALGAIGLCTNFDELSHSGFLPMVHGFIISALVVIVSFLVQLMMGQI